MKGNERKTKEKTLRKEKERERKGNYMIGKERA